MLKLLTSASLATALMVTAAFAQAPSPSTSPNVQPGAVQVSPPMMPEAAKPGASSRSPSATQDSAVAPSVTPSGTGVKLSDADATRWMNKAVYSSDDKNLGEVSGFMRAADGTVKELHADIGGFLGMGETRVRILPSQFKLGEDRVILNVNGEQAKTLPQISK